MNISTQRHLARRTLLKAAGATIGLPLLEAMMPAFARADAVKKIPRRMVAIQTNMGIIPQYFFPEEAGAAYALTPYLEKVAAHRKQMTIFSGCSHPGVTGGHAAEKCFLTGTPHPDRGGFRNTVSLDQYAAEHIGNETRFPSLTLACSNEGSTLSYTRSGAPISADKSPRKLFEKLFVQGKPGEIEANVEALRQGRSMLDFVGEQSRRLSRTLSKGDRQRLDQYFTSVRELEQRLTTAEAWEYKPKPVVKATPPEDIEDAKEFVQRTKLTLDVVKLALENDSSRLAFDKTNNYPLTNLHVSMLQRLGIETNEFSTAKGTMKGLEMA